MPRFDPTLTLGNLLTVASFILGGLMLAFGSPGDLIRVQARVVALELAQSNAERGQAEFRVELREELKEIKKELRAMNGVRWRDLPPSTYQDVPRNTR